MKRIAAALTVFLLLLCLYPLTTGAEQPVTAKEIAGTWSGEATLVQSSAEGDLEVSNVVHLKFNLQEDGTGTVEVGGLSDPIYHAFYQDGVLSADFSIGMIMENLFSATVRREGNWVIIEGTINATYDYVGGKATSVYAWSARKEIPLPAEEESIPTLTDPEFPADEDYSEWEWDWEDFCNCEDDPWEKHAGPLGAAIISIIAAIGAILGGTAGPMGGALAGALAEALGIAGLEPFSAGGADSAYGEGEPSPEEEQRGDLPGDDYFPPEAGFGGPEENPYTNHESGAGPGDCVRQGLPSYFINTATLNLVVQDTVFTNSGLGPDINLGLTYNSASSFGTIFGPGWCFTYDWLVEQKGNRVSIHKGSGQVLTFAAAGSGNREHPAEARPPSGILHRLLDYGSYWRMSKMLVVSCIGV